MRTLLLSIPDNKQAEQIVKELAQRLGLGGEAKLTDEAFVSLLKEAGVTMDAMVARPTLGCHCGGSKGAGTRTTGYGQTQHFLWWVHTKCRRPTQYIVDHFIPNMLNGCRDLLSEVVPNHKAVTDHLDRQARFRVAKQDLRDSRKYTLPSV